MLPRVHLSADCAKPVVVEDGGKADVVTAVARVNDLIKHLLSALSERATTLLLRFLQLKRIFLLI